MSRRLAIAGLMTASAFPSSPSSRTPPFPSPPRRSRPRRRPIRRSDRTRRSVSSARSRAARRRTHRPRCVRAKPARPAGMGQQQSQADRQYVQQMLALGTVSLQQSNFAHSKAQNPRVKQFAEFEIGEQNLLTDIMHSFADPNATASTTKGAQQSAATAPELPQKDAQTMERLSKAQPGAAFDKDYVTLQIQGHQELLKLQESYLPQGRQSRDDEHRQARPRADQGASGDAAGHSGGAWQIGSAAPLLTVRGRNTRPRQDVASRNCGSHEVRPNHEEEEPMARDKRGQPTGAGCGRGDERAGAGRDRR